MEQLPYQITGMPRWPHAFRDVVALIGDDAALELCRHYGGLEAYVPRKPRAHNALVKAVGLEVVEKLAESYGGTKIWPPLMKGLYPRDMIRELPHHAGGAGMPYRQY